MKNLNFKTLLFFIAISAMLFSCGSDDDNFEPPLTEVGIGKVKAKVNGADWTSKNTEDGVVYLSMLGSNTIEAFAEDGSYMNLKPLGSLSQGMTLESSGGYFQASYKPVFTESETFFAAGSLGSGTLTINTLNDNKFAGTFQFTGVKTNSDGTTEEVSITSGTFDIDL